MKKSFYLQRAKVPLIFKQFSILYDRATKNIYRVTNKFLVTLSGFFASGIFAEI
jgi:hypothetical protein